MPRDDFSNSVKIALAKRAGYRCAFPGCPAITMGPSDEGPAAVANTGTAAHISAASGGSGSRRYDPNLTPDQRASIDNGLWCCRDHGTLIDTDEITYSSVMLRGWRAIAERKAQLRQAHGDIQLTGLPDLVTIGLASESLKIISKDFANDVIGSVVTHCCLSDIWGKEAADSVRDFLIEYSRNAFDHGEASYVSVEFLPRRIVVEDDGRRHFDVHLLAPPDFGRGGGLAYRALLSALKINAISSKKTACGKNSIYIPLVGNTSELIANNPCAIEVTHDQLRLNTVDFSLIGGCDRAYLVAPDFMSYSDGPLCEKMLETAIATHKNVVLVVPRTSHAVLQYYRRRFPGTEVMSW